MVGIDCSRFKVRGQYTTVFLKSGWIRVLRCIGGVWCLPWVGSGGECRKVGSTYARVSTLEEGSGSAVRLPLSKCWTMCKSLNLGVNCFICPVDKSISQGLLSITRNTVLSGTSVFHSCEPLFISPLNLQRSTLRPREEQALLSHPGYYWQALDQMPIFAFLSQDGKDGGDCEAREHEGWLGEAFKLESGPFPPALLSEGGMWEIRQEWV